MPLGTWPDGLGTPTRKVLKTQTYTVGGSVTMPNGTTDAGNATSGSGVGATGPGWSATTDASGSTGDCGFTFASNGPETHAGPAGTVYATVSVGNATARVDYADVTIVPGYPGDERRQPPAYGRGQFGDTISGHASFSVLADLVLTTHGEELPEGAIPDDAYPGYGGARVVGEYPGNYAVLAWEPHPGSTVTGSVTFGDRSASCSAPSSEAAFGDSLSIALDLDHSPTGYADPSDALGYAWKQKYNPDGTLSASISLTGYPVESNGPAVTYSLGGRVNMTGSVGAGYASASVDTGVGGVPSGGIGGISVGGTIHQTRKATLALDAMAMDEPHPHAAHWWTLEKWLGTTDEADADGYHTIVDPPVPIWTERVGQSISQAIEQRRESLGVTAYQKAFDARARSGSCRPARGYVRSPRGPIYATLDDYVDEQGAVMAYVVPPPGEDPRQWRIGLRGRVGGGIQVTRAASVAVSLPAPTMDAGTMDAGTKDATYAFDPPLVAEGYRFADVASPMEGGATSVALGSKTWPIQRGATTTIDLCFPPGVGSSYIDRQDTRFPLDAQRRSTVDSPTWGVSVAARMVGRGGTIDSLVLKDANAATKVHPIAPFGPAWVQEVPDDELTTADGDSYTVEHDCARGILGDSAGRESFEVPHVRRTIDNAPNRLYSTDYAHLSCGEVAALIGEIPGWSAVGIPDDDGEDPPAWGAVQGFVRKGGSWIKRWDAAPGRIDAQAYYDGVEWPGDVGDVFGTGGGGGLSLVGRVVFRGSAYGPVDQEGTLSYSDLPSPAHPGPDDPPVSTAQSSGLRYLVGPTLGDPDEWGRVWTRPSHKASFGGVARRIERGAFLIPALAKLLAYAVSRNHRHGRATDHGSGLALDFAPNLRPFPWAQGEGVASADWATVAYPTQGRSDPLTVLYGQKGGAATLAYSNDEGKTLVPRLTIDVADYGAHCFAPHGSLYVFRLSGGTVYGRLYDRLLDLSTPEWTTSLTGLDTAPLAASTSVGGRGELRVHLQHFSGGELVFATSPDGKDFG